MPVDRGAQSLGGDEGLAFSSALPAIFAFLLSGFPRPGLARSGFRVVTPEGIPVHTFPKAVLQSTALCLVSCV